jgi:hypothetical protein
MSADVSGGWSDWRRTHEDEYFRKRDQELVDQARQRAEDEAARQLLTDAAGLHDDDILRDLQRLRYAPDTVTRLHLAPLIDVAWADGTVSDPERDTIVAAACARGVEAGSRGDRQVAQWLAIPPTTVLPDRTLHLLGALLHRRPADECAEAIRDLRASCAAVASALGGVFGFRPISDKEHHVIDRIFYELECTDPPSPRR